MLLLCRPLPKFICLHWDGRIQLKYNVFMGVELNKEMHDFIPKEID